MAAQKLLLTSDVILIGRREVQELSWKRLEAPQYVSCDGVLVIMCMYYFGADS